MAAIAGWLDEQRGEQVLDLVAGHRDQPGRCWVASVWVTAATTRKAWASIARVAQRYQERQRRT